MKQGLNRRGIAALALLLAGCATGPNNLYGGLNGQGVTGNEVSVIVSNVWNEMDAMPLADKHCKQYGKAARFRSIQNYKASFDCIAVQG
jgi:starvation-inducible outer membrane lipoprotein